MLSSIEVFHPNLMTLYLSAHSKEKKDCTCNIRKEEKAFVVLVTSFEEVSQEQLRWL